MLALVMLASFPVRAGTLAAYGLLDSIEDAVDDLYEKKTDGGKVNDEAVDFCKSNGNYDALTEFLKALPGPLTVFTGISHCFPETLEETANKCFGSESMGDRIKAEASRDARSLVPTSTPSLTSSGTEGKDTWWGKIFHAIMDAGNNVVSTTWTKVQESSIKLLGVAFGLWLAMVTMPMLGSLKEQDPLDYLTKIGAKVFKVCFAAALLANRQYFFDYFISPIFDVAAGFAGVDAGDISGGSKAMDSIKKPMLAVLLDIDANLAMLKGIGKVLMTCLFKVDALMGAVGLKILWFDVGVIFKIFDLPNIYVILSGCFIWISGIVLGVAFPFRVFDACFRLGIVLTLSPLYIIAWVFDITKNFAATGFKCVLQVAFLFIFLNITMKLNMELILKALDLDGINIVSLAQSNGSEIPLAIALLKPFMTYKAIGAIFTLIVSLIFCLGMLMKVDDLANTFGGVSFSSKTADYTASKIAQPVLAGANSVRNIASQAIHAPFENAAMRAMNNSKEGSLKRSLARSYLRTRGVTSDDVRDARAKEQQRGGSASGGSGTFGRGGSSYESKMQAKQDAKQQRQEAKAQKQEARAQKREDRAERKQEVNARKDLRRQALMHQDADKIRAAIRTEDDEGLKSLQASFKGDSKVWDQIVSDGQAEKYNPALAKAHSTAGAALRTQHNAHVAVQNKAEQVKGAVKDHVIDPVKDRAQAVGGAVHARATQFKGAVHDKAESVKDAVRENVVNPIKEGAQTVGGAVHARATQFKEGVRENVIDPVKQGAQKVGETVAKPVNAVRDGVQEVKTRVNEFRDTKQNIADLAQQQAQAEKRGDFTQMGLLKQQKEALQQKIGGGKLGARVAQRAGKQGYKQGSKS